MAFKVKEDWLFIDRWPYVAMDKGVHFLGGAMIVFVVELLLRLCGVMPWVSTNLALVISMMCSVLIECVDGFGKDGFSWEDLVYGTFGACAFTVLYNARLGIG